MAKEEVKSYLQQYYLLSNRWCCRILKMGRHPMKLSINEANRQLIKRMQQLAIEYPAYGCPLLHQLLKAEGSES